MRAVSAKRARANRVRKEAERVLFELDPYCARCGSGYELHGHERLGRSQGGDPAKPDCLACNLCNTRFEDFPELAAWEGWKISKKYERDPRLGTDEARTIWGGVYTFPDIYEATA